MFGRGMFGAHLKDFAALLHTRHGVGGGAGVQLIHFTVLEARLQLRVQLPVWKGEKCTVSWRMSYGLSWEESAYDSIQ